MYFESYTGHVKKSVGKEQFGVTETLLGNN